MVSPGLRWPAPGSDPRRGGEFTGTSAKSSHGWEDDPPWFRWFGTVTTASRASLRPAFPGMPTGPGALRAPHPYALRARGCRRPVRRSWHASPLPPQCGCRCRSGGRSETEENVVPNGRRAVSRGVARRNAKLTAPRELVTPDLAILGGGSCDGEAGRGRV